MRNGFEALWRRRRVFKGGASIVVMEDGVFTDHLGQPILNPREAAGLPQPFAALCLEQALAPVGTVVYVDGTPSQLLDILIQTGSREVRLRGLRAPWGWSTLLQTLRPGRFSRPRQGKIRRVVEGAKVGMEVRLHGLESVILAPDGEGENARAMRERNPGWEEAVVTVGFGGAWG